MKEEGLRSGRVRCWFTGRAVRTSTAERKEMASEIKRPLTMMRLRIKVRRARCQEGNGAWTAQHKGSSSRLYFFAGEPVRRSVHNISPEQLQPLIPLPSANPYHHYLATDSTSAMAEGQLHRASTTAPVNIAVIKFVLPQPRSSLTAFWPCYPKKPTNSILQPQFTPQARAKRRKKS